MKPTSRDEFESYKDICKVRYLLYTAYHCESVTEKQKLIDDAIIKVDAYKREDFAEYTFSCPKCGSYVETYLQKEQAEEE